MLSFLIIFDCCREDFKIISGESHDACEVYSAEGIAHKKWVLEARNPGEHDLYFSISFRNTQQNEPNIDICDVKIETLKIDCSLNWMINNIKDNCYKVAILLVAFSSAFVALPKFFEKIKLSNIWWKLLIFLALLLFLIPLFSVVLG